MTDARFPERWLNDRRLQRLDAEQFRSYITALAWSVANRTDGRIASDDLCFIPNFTFGTEDAFARCGLWTRLDGAGWLITDFAATQTTRAEHEILERARVREREKKARQRARKTAGQSDVPGDSPDGLEGGPHRTGQAGQDRHREVTNYISDVGEKLDDGYLAAVAADEPPTDADADYVADLLEWCAEDQRAHYDRLTDRNVRDGYER